MIVECEKTGFGIRIIFSYNEGMADAFEISDPKGISAILALMSHDVSPEALMVEIRNMSGLTLH